MSAEFPTPPPEQVPLLDRPDRKAVFIGRGSNLTEDIGRLVLDLTGAEKPEVLIIPTPATKIENHKNHVNRLTEIYGGLGARVSVLHEYGELPTQQQIDDFFGRAHAHSITGGSTVNALDAFTRTGIGQAILDFRGVSSGGSAGLNIQATKAMSWVTPEGENHPELNRWEMVDGLLLPQRRGMVHAVVSPHNDMIEGDFKDDPGENVYNGKLITDPREYYFIPRLRTLLTSDDPFVPRIGIGVDNDSVLAFDGEGGFIVRNQSDAEKRDHTSIPVGVSAYHLLGEELVTVHYLPTRDARPIAELTTPPLTA